MIKDRVKYVNKLKIIYLYSDDDLPCVCILCIFFSMLKAFYDYYYKVDIINSFSDIYSRNNNQRLIKELCVNT